MCWLLQVAVGLGARVVPRFLHPGRQRLFMQGERELAVGARVRVTGEQGPRAPHRHDTGCCDEAGVTVPPLLASPLEQFEHQSDTHPAVLAPAEHEGFACVTAGDDPQRRPAHDALRGAHTAPHSLQAHTLPLVPGATSAGPIVAHGQAELSGGWAWVGGPGSGGGGVSVLMTRGLPAGGDSEPGETAAGEQGIPSAGGGRDLDRPSRRSQNWLDHRRGDVQR